MTFENDDTGFRVLRVAADPDGQRVSVVGRMQRVTAGARIRVAGRFEADARHGRQLRVETLLVLDPDTQEGTARFLGSGLIPGIGPALAKRIVDHFGDATLDVLEREPGRLSEVAGLGARRVGMIATTWQEQRALRDVMVFLQGHGVSATISARVFRRYGADAIRVVSANPYRLALDVWGIGFRKADEIARRLGIERDAPERVRAAVLHTLEAASERGHVFVPKALLTSESESVAGVDVQLVEEAIDALCASPEARLEELDDIGKVVYRARRFVEESGLAHGLARLATAHATTLTGVEQAVQIFEQQTGTQLAPEQQQAVTWAAQASALVITGGPGVGKTTVVRALLALFDHARLQVRLAAPTGRASRRMSEATGREATTIHRMLEFEPRGGGFVRNEGNPLAADVVIIDESSMLDQSLAFALVRALATGTRLVLVGDVDQLPSIGPGAVLRDVIESGKVPCVRMSHIFRQAAESRIVSNAHRIREGRAPETPPVGDRNADFYVVNARDAEAAADLVLRIVVERIPRQFQLDPRRDVQVLTPMHKGSAGSTLLNTRLQEALNPAGRQVTLGPRTFRVGDKVMQLRNDYGREVFNGDMGFVSSADMQLGRLTADIEGREVEYEASQVDELVLAYACSIHKSQGSEYPAVVIPMVAAHFVMLSRNLLYTAVTRGKRLVVLVTDQRAMRWALSDARREERYAYLFQRLREAMDRAAR